MDDLTLDDVTLILSTDINADVSNETYVSDSKPLTLTIKQKKTYSKVKQN
jgi:hypothetical protein